MTLGLVAAVAALSALGIGCGGGGEETASANITKAEFLKQASAVCAERKKEWNSIAYASLKEHKEEGNELTPKEANKLLDETLFPLMEEEQEKLERLEVPAGDEAQIQKMFQTRAKSLEEVESGGVTALGDPATFGKFWREAQAYGLSCFT
jgi:precorrin-2 methylase